MAPATVWSVFSGTVERFADRTAVEVLRPDRVDRFTYQELSDLATARASWLVAQGIGPGDRCAILAHNDAHWCATYLGILKIGAIAVPLDTNYSAAQVATIVADCSARVLFTTARLAPVAKEALTGRDVPISDLHESAPDASAFARTPAGELRRDPAEAPFGREGGPDAPDAPAVILYTSGTTSDPKGVVLTHANLLAERDAAFQVVTVTEADTILGVLPLFHSLAQLANLLLPFMVGARVVFLETINSTDLVRALSERSVTIFACVPQFFYLIHQRVTDRVRQSGVVTRAVFRVLLALNFRLRRMGLNAGPVFFGKVHDVMGRRMRLLVTGGSKFDPAIGRDLYSLGFTILQAYGLTETSAAATINRADEAHVDTVGRALPGVEITILPPESSDADGEIAIKGPIVMQGYYNRPDATAEVMRDGWFLTGDLGRMDAEGRITITGRKKEMIVLASGKNIYPEEIEAHYRQSAFIKELCVLGLSTADRPSTERLHAVIVPDMDVLREKQIVNAGDVLRFEIEGLAVGLPPHKRVLGYDVSFEPLPRTTTGKVKRHEVARRLREQQRAAVRAAAAPLSDADEAWLREPHAEAAVASIAQRVKAGARIRPDANLELDLGLDSMERVELLTELEQRFGVQVARPAVAGIFTVRHLVDAVRSGAGAPVAAPVERTDDSWAILLRDLPPETDPVLSGLLDPKPASGLVLFALLRMLRLVMPRIDVSGLDALPADRAFLICPNHQSFLDSALLCAALPYPVFRRLFFVGAAEYFSTPLTAWFARTVNCVPVDPDANLVPAMQAGAFGLAHGKVLILFPEGERSIDGRVKKFKKGAPILARHLRVPIVPVALNGIFEVWPRNRPINRRTLWPWSRHRIRMTFGAPLSFEDDESYADAAARLRDRVEELWLKAEG